MTRFRQLAVLLLLTIWTLTVSATTFEWVPMNPEEPDGPEALLISGEIRRGASGSLRILAADNIQKLQRSLVILASPGGDVAEALLLANVIKKAYISVLVDPRRGRCASACFFLYVAAVERAAVPPGLGVHRPYFGDDTVRSMSIRQAEQEQRRLMGVVASFLDNNDVPRGIKERMLSLSSTEVHWLNWDEIDALGPRAHWYDQLLVSRCKLDKALEAGFLREGEQFNRAAEAKRHIAAVAECAQRLTAAEGDKVLRDFVRGRAR